jgi:hypothetical protein
MSDAASRPQLSDIEDLRCPVPICRSRDISKAMLSFSDGTRRHVYICNLCGKTWPVDPYRERPDPPTWPPREAKP